MLIVKSVEQFDATFPRGKVFVFTRNAVDATDALHAVLAQHRDRNDEIILINSDDVGEVLGFSSLPHPLAIPLDQVDEEVCAAIAQLVESEKPCRVYLPSLVDPFAFLALQVWEGVRRATHRVCIGVGELDQPLADVSVWVEHDTVEKLSATRAQLLQSFRASCYGSERLGNALMILDPKDTMAPFVPNKRPVSVQNNPQVSVIIRTTGRLSLTNAINSVAQQTWSSIEVVIVNVGTGLLDTNLESQWSSLQLNVVNFCAAGRSAAANAGMEAAKGEFFVFLDDDDYLYPAHIFQLITALQSEPDRLVAYGGIRIESTDASGKKGVASLLDEPFSLDRLRLRNFIPIHACLTRRRVIDQGIRFDADLDRYEDWDFWLQIAEISPFLHVPGAVGVYKVSNSSGIAKAPVLGVYERWISRCGLGELEKIADWALSESTPAARQLQVDLEATRSNHLADQRRAMLERDAAVQQAKEAATGSSELQKQRAAFQHAAQQAHEGASAQIEKLQSALSETRSELTQSRALISNYQKSLLDSEQSVAGVRHELSTVYRSTSWKVLSPVRAAVTFTKRPQRLWSLIHAYGGGLKGVGQIAKRALRASQRHGVWATLVHGYRLLSVAPSNSSISDVEFSVQKRGVRRPVVAPSVHIDIVVCVHNALDDIRRCLHSIRQFTAANYTLIVVDDGSAEPTRDFLLGFAAEFSCVRIRHEQAKGYTCAANAGMKASTAPFVVLLNSDTIVGPAWIERLYTCIESDPNLAMVGPLSNCASWQSIPEVESKTGGDWADNPLPDHVSPESMSIQVANDSAQIYPRLSFLNGFCQMIRRRALDEVGMLDEESFPQGYGEENDLCVRLRKAGWQLAVSDDVWVFHAQSKSYSNERRIRLCAAAAENLARKHGMHNIEIGARQCRESISLKGIRARTMLIHDRLASIEAGKSHFAGKKLLFVLPSSDAGGGANVIMSEAKALVKMGVVVNIVNLKLNQNNFEKNYGDFNIPVHYITEPSELLSFVKDYDAVIASIFYTVDWISTIASDKNAPILGYYVQDFEPNFFKTGSSGYHQALASYTAIPNLVCFCKTQWNQDIVLKETGAHCVVVGPSVDLDCFRPSDRPTRERIRISAMVRPNSPYRSPKITVDILNEVAQSFADKVEITTFGVDIDDPAFQALNPGAMIKHLGKLNSFQLTEVLNDSDIFVDFSTYQAMGLTAMEAMASHCAVILPKRGGSIELAKDRVSAIYADVSEFDECRNAVFELIRDTDLRTRLADTALKAVQNFYPERAALNMLQALFDSKSIKLKN